MVRRGTRGRGTRNLHRAECLRLTEWYPSKAQHGKVVPTWNYETVHIRGMFVAHDDTEWKRSLVTRLTERHESRFERQWAPTTRRLTTSIQC
ncbi:MAG: FMN-binding negative transcriptional regulator [Ilumatobacteraceae bacterium]